MLLQMWRQTFNFQAGTVRLSILLLLLLLLLPDTCALANCLASLNEKQTLLCSRGTTHRGV